MVTWDNLDTLASFQNLSKTGRIDLKKVMSGENGAERDQMDFADDHRRGDRIKCDQGLAGAADGHPWENGGEPGINCDSGKRRIGACRHLSCVWHDRKK